MDTKEHLLVSAGQLFLKFGVKSITMDDIARHLSISKKTIYQYFADKDDLIEQFVKLHLAEQTRQMDEIYNTSANAVEELYKLSEWIKVTLGTMNPTALYDLEKYHKKAYSLYLLHKEECVISNIAKSLQKGISEGYFRNDINIDIISRMRMEQVQMAFNPIIFPIERINFQEIQIQLFEHFVYGIVTIKGYRLYNKLKNITSEE